MQRNAYFIPVDIMEDVVELTAQKLLGRLVPVDAESEALQGRILKFWRGSKRLSSSVETFVGWIANKSPPWVAYCASISGRLISIDKQPGIRLVGVR